MDKCSVIAKKLISSERMTVRDFLGSGIETDVSDEQHTWLSHYDGKSELTADGIARWSASGALDFEITVDGENAVVHGLKTDGQEKSVCALFNTLAGNVNENTYQKYVKK